MEFTDIQHIRTLVTLQVYETLKRAVEIGKWANGVALTAEQRAHCLQVIIIYDTFNKEEFDRVGYVGDARRGCRRETSVSIATSTSVSSARPIHVVDMLQNRDKA